MVEFVKHIEKQFKDGMTWDNYGRSSGGGDNKHWEIDHIIPINYEKPSLEDVKERLVYTNCQPMWAEVKAIDILAKNITKSIHHQIRILKQDRSHHRLIPCLLLFQYWCYLCRSHSQFFSIDP